jgi:hypothetical protein
MGITINLVGILLFVDALVHFYAGFFIGNDNPQVMLAGGVITLVLCALAFLGFSEKRSFQYSTTAILVSGILYNLWNFGSTGFPQWVIGVILALDIVISIGLIRKIITR